MSTLGPIVVAIDGSDSSDAAIRWAGEEAESYHAALRLVFVFHWARLPGSFPIYGAYPDPSALQSRRLAEQVVAEAVDVARAANPGVDVSGEAIDGDIVPTLVRESSHASSIVLGSRRLGTLGSWILGSVSSPVAARAACPAIVVRGPSGLPEETPQVVVGVDASEDSEDALAFAFAYASRHHTPLKAVLCYHPDALATMLWRSEPPAPTRVEAWLSEALTGWQEKYPDVDVHRAVIREHPVAGLVTESLSADLLVVGTRGRHALAGTLLGSVSQGVLHQAVCPVAVVPAHTD
jgi:nucleotide-binding universal stress UspA family protein